MSLPNGESQKLIKKIYFKYKKIRFIDLSADFRLLNPSVYKKYYNKKHKAIKLLRNSIYSLSEFVKKKIKNYRIIANPGCYPTSIQIPLIPLIKKKLIKLKNLTIDSKSGFSGAGKNLKRKFKHRNIYSSIHAYGIKNHRHIAEIDQELKKYSKKKIEYSFNPHILPTYRGILSTIYVDLSKDSSIIKLRNELIKYYKKEKFIKIHKINFSLGTGNVLNTNNCEISICETKVKNRIVIFSAIDNLVKGASGQAIQNMNLMFNFNEKMALR